MRIIIAGGGDVGVQVAQLLSASSNDVTIIEKDRNRAATLSEWGLAVVAGNACRPEVIETAGGLRTDVLVACTARDEENLVIAVLAKRHLDIPRVVARVNLEANGWLFGEDWGVDAAISSVAPLVALIEEATGSAETLRLADLAGAGLTLIEVILMAGSPAVGRTRDGLGLDRNDVVAVVIRSDHAVPVEKSLTFCEGDRLLVVTSPDGEERVRSVFQAQSGIGPGAPLPSPPD